MKKQSGKRIGWIASFLTFLAKNAGTVRARVNSFAEWYNMQYGMMGLENAEWVTR